MGYSRLISNIECAADFDLPGSLWETYEPPFRHDVEADPEPLDPLPYRPHDYNRTAKDPSLLRAQTKSKRNGFFLRRINPHFNEVDVYRVYS